MGRSRQLIRTLIAACLDQVWSHTKAGHWQLQYKWPNSSQVDGIFWQLPDFLVYFSKPLLYWHCICIIHLRFLCVKISSPSNIYMYIPYVLFSLYTGTRVIWSILSVQCIVRCVEPSWAQYVSILLHVWLLNQRGQFWFISFLNVVTLIWIRLRITLLLLLLLAKYCRKIWNLVFLALLICFKLGKSQSYSKILLLRHKIGARQRDKKTS